MLLKKKTNGFTLIELLAVIVILAIIALIATPIILGVIADAKKGADKDSILGYIEAVELQILANKIDNDPSNDIVDKTYTTDELEDLGVIIKGTKPNGTITIEDGKITYGSLSVNDNTFAIEDGKIVEKNNYREAILKGNDPVIQGKMIPITIEEDGTVKKADISSEWYNYQEKRWANAVLVNEETREKYINAKGEEEISTDDILAYFVWIPRYKYQLFNTSSETKVTSKEIKVTFENSKTSKSNGTIDGEWLTAPGFTFGNEELNGFWIAKFETTGTETIPTVLPNSSSLVNQNLSAEYATSQKFSNEKLYGILNETHIIRNEEWAAVAYLSHSIYGINQQIRINNYFNDQTLTGCGASTDDAEVSSICSIVYGSSESYPQSTTGNIYGVFDMSGGAWERVMFAINDGTDHPYIGQADGYNSGFTGLLNTGEEFVGVDLPNPKYYTLLNQYQTSFSSTDVVGVCSLNNCLGQAFLETRSLYNDTNNFPQINYPWLVRGGNFNSMANSGIFCFSPSRAYANQVDSFRITMMP